MRVETRIERERMELPDHPIVAHIGEAGSHSLVALCGRVCKSGGVDATHRKWDGQTYCEVCLQLNGGPPNWWRS